MTQRMFHGALTAEALADQLAARFHERHYRTSIRSGNGTALVQIGSEHGTPATVHIADTAGGVLVTVSRDRDWLDKAGDAAGMLERAVAGNPLSILTMIPDLIGEMQKENIAPAIWNVIQDICALSRSLAGEKNAPGNPIACPYCAYANQPGSGQCAACGAPLPVDLPRVCPKCSRAHTSDALFCQACGTRLVEG
ncbi:MAG: zinc ribbon domain-containing protein [Chloroflexota bacterium]